MVTFLLSALFWALFLVWLACCAILVLVILNQEPKGGGVGAMFGQGSVMGEALGVSGIANTLRRITTFSAVTFMVLSIVLAGMAPMIWGNTYGFGGGSSAAQAPALTVESDDAGEPITLTLDENAADDHAGHDHAADDHAGHDHSDEAGDDAAAGDAPAGDDAPADDMAAADEGGTDETAADEGGADEGAADEAPADDSTEDK